MADKPTDKPTTADNKGKSVLDYVIKFFKDMFGYDINAVLTLAAPQMRRAAEALAQKLKKDLPSDHPLRSDIAEIIINELASRIEATSEDQPKAMKAVLEKLSDFIEIFASSFCGEDSTTADGKKPSTKPTATKVVEVFKEFDGKFMEDQRVRLAKAKPEDKKAVAKQLEAEAIHHAKIKVLMTEGPPQKKPKPESPKEKGEPWTAKFKTGWVKFTTWTASCWTKNTEKLRPFNETLNAKIKVLKTANQQWQPTATQVELGRKLESPLQTIWRLIFGSSSKKPKSKNPFKAETLTEI